MAAAATSSITNFFSFLSISKSSQIHHNSVSINFQSLPKSKQTRLFASRGNVASSSQEPKGVSSRILNYNVLITVGENESEDQVVNRFRTQVLRAGILQECKRRRFFENSQAKRKRKAREAAKRNRKRLADLISKAKSDEFFMAEFGFCEIVLFLIFFLLHYGWMVYFLSFSLQPNSWFRYQLLSCLPLSNAEYKSWGSLIHEHHHCSSWFHFPLFLF